MTIIAKKFKKGDTVFLIQDQNGRGRVFIEKMGVSTWGKKRVTLKDQNGHAYQVEACRVNVPMGMNHVNIRVISVDDGIEVAEAIAWDIAHHTAAKEQNYWAGYIMDSAFQYEKEYGQRNFDKIIAEVDFRVMI